MRETAPTITVIEPKTGWVPVDFREIWNYRELLYFLTKRDIKVRYKQTVLGGLWAVIQPAFTMLVFTLFFGRLAKMPSDGLPYPIFVYAGLLPWTYFANAVSASGNSLVGSSNLITKVYFPRIVVPASAALAGLLDFFIALFVLAALMIWYQVLPGPGIFLFPFLVALTFLCAVGVGLWLSALNVQYRDIRYAIPFLVQVWMFVSPVIYPVSLVHGNYQWLLALNPMGGVIHAYRAALLGHQPIDWGLLGLSTLIILALFLGGLYYFRRMEKEFADVV
ncbi:MAG: ABC transporter permease [Deltaproteobacteria bacterium]|jgi:lipopolysaccharide transport system permease protein|nr:ABC transporter permease [Deltaproteobacteria bacterium]NTV55787.1 ABC transporter permease [Deltaproteobacteria bacterium]